ncbi:MAG: hypothetical protein BWX78_01578 [Firmicutes bacterium ADurb.Bin099]|nr:MAG: hypothetical protein BWX78_01578 [Firmicutes bacterium ADurb.Bin099]
MLFPSDQLLSKILDMSMNSLLVKESAAIPSIVRSPVVVALILSRYVSLSARTSLEGALKDFNTDTPIPEEPPGVYIFTSDSFFNRCILKPS